MHGSKTAAVKNSSWRSRTWLPKVSGGERTSNNRKPAACWLKLAVFCAICGAPLPVFAQSGALPSRDPAVGVTITFPGAVPIKTRGSGRHFPLVGARPHQSIEIKLQFSPAFANTPVVAQALDGGSVRPASQTAALAGDGSVSLRFQAAEPPGLYRVLVNAGGTTSVLRFWVQNPNSREPAPKLILPTGQ